MPLNGRAVVFTAPRSVEVQDVSVPDPADEDVVVRVTHSWISNGTEGSFLRGERAAGDTPYRPGLKWPFPIVSGYQKIGVVETIGARITDIDIGDTIFATMGKVLGMYEPRGGQVSPSVSARSGVWKIPKDVDPLAVAGLVLTQVGYNSGIRPDVQAGDTAVVIGDGLVGHWAAQTLAWRGARVCLLGRHADRLCRFTDGSTGSSGSERVTLDQRQENWIGQLRRIFPEGIRHLVDTVGSIQCIEQLLPLTVRFGHFVSAGFYGTEDRFALQPARDKELTMHLVSGWSAQRMDRTLELISAGHLHTLPLITHHFPVARAADAWKLIEHKSEPVLGVILDWKQESR